MVPTHALAALLAGVPLAACNPDTDLHRGSALTDGGDAGGAGLAASSSAPGAPELLDPPAGLADVPTNLASVLLGFAEAVSSVAATALTLQPPGSGGAVALALADPLPCARTCYAFTLGDALMPATTYAVRVPAGALAFLDGKPVPAADLGSFTTASAADSYAPRVQAFTLSVAEGCVAAHVATDEQARAVVSLSTAGSSFVIASAGYALAFDLIQRYPELPADMQASGVARLVDRAGNTGSSAPVSVELPGPGPRVVISEVLANPAGSETTQEFVEIYNAGDGPVALDGWSIEDKAGKDVLPESTLAAASYALIVSDGYDPSDGKDPAAAAGTLLIRVAGRIAGDGLANAGEPIRLLDRAGHVVSQYGGWVDASATSWSGKSSKRVSIDACDAADAWSKTPSLPTPGW